MVRDQESRLSPLFVALSLSVFTFLTVFSSSLLFFSSTNLLHHFLNSIIDYQQPPTLFAQLASPSANMVITNSTTLLLRAQPAFRAVARAGKPSQESHCLLPSISSQPETANIQVDILPWIRMPCARASRKFFGASNPPGSCAQLTHF